MSCRLQEDKYEDFAEVLALSYDSDARKRLQALRDDG